MVTREGLPIGYEVYAGNTFEGHTLIPVLQNLRNKYKIKDIVFVADSGMLNEKNLTKLEEEGFEYIVGAKIKGESDYFKKEILNKNNYNSEDIAEIKKTKETRLIVSYSPQRAKKDSKDREKAIERLKKRLVSKDKVTKSLIGNQGARKYLKLVGETNLYFDNEKIEGDKAWDGLKGVITNNLTMTSKEVLDKYQSLWHVEKVFRMNKDDLRIRPIYHRLERRIKAHLMIAFAALCIARAAELRFKPLSLSFERIKRALSKVMTVNVVDKHTGFNIRKLVRPSKEVIQIYSLIGLPI